MDKGPAAPRGVRLLLQEHRESSDVLEHVEQEVQLRLREPDEENFLVVDELLGHLDGGGLEACLDELQGERRPRNLLEHSPVLHGDLGDCFFAHVPLLSLERDVSDDIMVMVRVGMDADEKLPVVHVTRQPHRILLGLFVGLRLEVVRDLVHSGVGQVKIDRLVADKPVEFHLIPPVRRGPSGDDDTLRNAPGQSIKILAK